MGTHNCYKKLSILLIPLFFPHTFTIQFSFCWICILSYCSLLFSSPFLLPWLGLSLTLSFLYCVCLEEVSRLFQQKLHTFRLEKKRGSCQEREEEQKPPLHTVHTLLDRVLGHTHTDHPAYDISLQAVQSDMRTPCTAQFQTNQKKISNENIDTHMKQITETLKNLSRCLLLMYKIYQYLRYRHVHPPSILF